MKSEYMMCAVREAWKGIRAGAGGPFGSVVVCGETIVSRAHNRVVATFDPTAHAEILAIRKASRKLKRFDLSDCELFTTCEPCPMCFAAIYWARIRIIYYGCRQNDAARIGFDDARFHKIFGRGVRAGGVRATQLERRSCLEVFRAWRESPDRVIY